MGRSSDQENSPSDGNQKSMGLEIFNGIAIFANGLLNTYNQHQNRKFQKEQSEERLALQEEISSLQRETQMAIAKGNWALQRELQSKSRSLQRELAMFSARNARKNLLDSISFREMYQGWPLFTLPEDIANSYPEHPFRPIRIMIIPFQGKNTKDLDDIYNVVRQRTGEFLEPYGNNKYVEFLGDNWKASYLGESAVRKINNALYLEPFLIIQPEIVRDKFNLKLYYWNIGDTAPTTQTFINSLPIDEFPSSNIAYNQGREKEDFENKCKLVVNTTIISIALLLEMHFLAHNLSDKLLFFNAIIKKVDQLQALGIPSLNHSLLDEVVGSYDKISNVLFPREEMLSTNSNNTSQLKVSSFLDQPKLAVDIHLSIAKVLLKYSNEISGRKYLTSAFLLWSISKNTNVDDFKNINYHYFISRYGYDDDFFTQLVSLLLNYDNSYIPDYIKVVAKFWVTHKLES